MSTLFFMFVIFLYFLSIINTIRLGLKEGKARVEAEAELKKRS
jgi:hypothetical protein